MSRGLNDNVHGYITPDICSFEEKAIHWYRGLSLGKDPVDDMTGFNNGIMMAYGMCPPPTTYRSSTNQP